MVLLYKDYTNLKPDIFEKTKKGLKREVFTNFFVFASFINVIYIFLVLVNFVFPSLVSYILDGDFVNAPFFENIYINFSIIYTSITLLVLLFILWAINVVILKIANYIYLRIVNSYQFKKELRNQDKPIPN